ncbi:NOB1 family endonuclease [Thermogladius sp. 4427co]|uniref:NOB1 family endonuclease n=1 Tax=Thermogladius sp. 4427co TaxID=3450718 RepID=UPI003F794B68
MFSLRESSSRKIAVVADTGALLARYYNLLPIHVYDFYTTKACVQEVRDRENKEALENAIELGLVRVVEIDKEYFEKALNKAREIGELTKVSEADLSIIALALSLSETYDKVIVLTDDYSLQNILYNIGISFKPVRTTGIREAWKFREYCPVCGYVPGKPGEKTCPVCGSPLKRVRVS